MTDKIGLVILAAGQGKRLNSDTPKPLLPLMGRKLIDYPLLFLERFVHSLDIQGHIGIVVGHAKEEVIQHIGEMKKTMKTPCILAHQNEQKGTANALKAYMATPQAASVDTIVVICADTPLMTLEDLQLLHRNFKQHRCDAVLASFKTSSPEGLGRIVRQSMGHRIVEEKDADSDTKQINEVNSGLYIFKKDYVEKYLGNVDNNNKAQEYYLTDLFDFDRNVKAVAFPSGENFQGINTMAQLHDVERILRWRKLSSLMNNGVRILDTSSTFIDEDVCIGPYSEIHPFVTIKGHSSLESGVTVESSSLIKESTIGQDSLIKGGSYLEKATIGQDTSIGPYAHLRPGTVIEDRCRVGNFVEIKKSLLKKGAKVAHLSYVGDAEIGEQTNIGCGFITCNYDGKNKHKTIIGDHSFIGSDTQVIAPITIGDHCYVASGSTINKDLQEGDFAIARARQTVRPREARKFLKKT